MGYSKAPEQPQSSARPICHSHTMMSTRCEPATICIAAYRSSPVTHCATGDDDDDDDDGDDNDDDNDGNDDDNDLAFDEYTVSESE